MVKLIALTLTAVLAAQDARPDFTGTWRSAGRIRNADTRIEQTASTFASAPAAGAAHMIVYPTDGTTTKSEGQRKVMRTGHWEGHTLILESTGTFRFHRHTTRR